MPKKTNLPPQPKKPSNAFFLYRKAMRTFIAEKYNISRSHEIAKQAAEMWKNETEEVRAYYKEQSQLEFAKHKEQYPDYIWPSGNNSIKYQMAKKQQQQKIQFQHLDSPSSRVASPIYFERVMTPPITPDPRFKMDIMGHPLNPIGASPVLSTQSVTSNNTLTTSPLNNSINSISEITQQSQQSQPQTEKEFTYSNLSAPFYYSNVTPDFTQDDNFMNPIYYGGNTHTNGFNPYLYPPTRTQTPF